MVCVFHLFYIFVSLFDPSPSLWPMSPSDLSVCRHLLCLVKETSSTGLTLSRRVTCWVRSTHSGSLPSRSSFTHILYDVTLYSPCWSVRLNLLKFTLNGHLRTMRLFVPYNAKRYSVCSSWWRFWPTVRSWQWVTHRRGANLWSKYTDTHTNTQQNIEKLNNNNDNNDSNNQLSLVMGSRWV